MVPNCRQNYYNPSNGLNILYDSYKFACPICAQLHILLVHQPVVEPSAGRLLLKVLTVMNGRRRGCAMMKVKLDARLPL